MAIVAHFLVERNMKHNLEIEAQVYSRAMQLLGLSEADSNAKSRSCSRYQVAKPRQHIVTKQYVSTSSTSELCNVSSFDLVEKYYGFSA